MYGLELFNTISSYAIALNIHADIAKNEAANMRMFEVTGLGTCLITDYKNNLSDFFSNEEILIYKNKFDCFETLVWAIKNPNLVNIIALAGQKKTLSNHTYFNRAKKILQILNEN
jgi:spore maturation protein CgeB